MAHHKRGKPKSSRSGCLLCKPHKHQRRKKLPRSKREQTVLSDAIDPEPILSDAEIRLIDYEAFGY